MIRHTSLVDWSREMINLVGRCARRGSTAMPAGQSTVEMAIIIPLLLVLLLGAADFGLAFNAASELTPAAREGARHGAWWNGNTSTNPYADDADIVSAVSDNLSISYGSALNVIAAPAGIHSCPASPIPSSDFPSSAGTVWVFVCYDNTAGNTAVAPGQPIAVTITEVSSALQQFAAIVPTFKLSASTTINVEGL